MTFSTERPGFAQAARKAWRDGCDGGGLRLGVGGSFSVEALCPYIGGALRLKGILCQTVLPGPFNQLFQICQAPQAAFGGGVDVVGLLFRIEDLFPGDFQAYISGDEEARLRILRGASELAGAVRLLRNSHAGAVIVSVPPCPASPACDLRDLVHSARVARLHRHFVEQWLSELQGIPETFLLDLDSLQRTYGDVRSRDARKWFLYRQPYAEDFLALLGAEIGRLYSALRMPPRKCVVLDCDNTLWGGVVGEDGLGGIQLGNEFPGNVYREFQRKLLDLHAQGVLLALASKNNEKDVWEVFDKHDGMLLRREHVSAWKINWRPKADNLRAIAADLGIGTDSLAFIDDSPFELEEVRLTLPEVACLAVPEEITGLPEILALSQLFDRLAVTEEDRSRGSLQKQAARRTQEAMVVGREEFLKSLQLVVEIFPATEAHVHRVAQLINKTNQFNLSGFRQDQVEVAGRLRSSRHRIYALQAADRFGDYGLVGVACATRNGDALLYDTFLLSCRALGRGIEHAFMAGLRDMARKEAARRMQVVFKLTTQNAATASFLPSCNFRQLDSEWWATDIESVPACPGHIRLVLTRQA